MAELRRAEIAYIGSHWELSSSICTTAIFSRHLFVTTFYNIASSACSAPKTVVPGSKQIHIIMLATTNVWCDLHGIQIPRGTHAHMRARTHARAHARTCVQIVGGLRTGQNGFMCKMLVFSVINL